MAFWKKNKNWEDEYDEYYAQDRRLGNDGRKRGNGLRFFAHSLTLMFVGATFLSAVGMVNGQTMIEKIVTELLMPVGLVWLILTVMIYFCLLNRQAWPALTGFACWLVLTVAGNSFISNWLISTLEAPYQNIDPLKMEPLDTIVVLGGGTSSRLNGQPQFSLSGDRVGLAARMFHAGQVKTIICTGSDSFRSSANDLHPREESAALLTSLGVPPATVLQIEGKNTSQEMENLKALFQQSPTHGRVGILTSAWHLRRALALASANQLELVPVPADFLAGAVGPSPNLIVPGVGSIYVTARAMKEYLARLVGR